VKSAHRSRTAHDIQNYFRVITKLCRKKAEVIQNHLIPHVSATEQAEAKNREHNRPKFVVVRPRNFQESDRSFAVVKLVKTKSGTGACIDRCSVYILPKH
jgi:hypothetical protein